MENSQVPGYKKYSYYYIPLIFFVLSVTWDLVTYAFMRLPVVTNYLPSLVLMVILTALVCLTQRKWLQVVILTPFFGLQIFLGVSNILCFTVLNEIFSLENFLSIVNAINASKSTSYNLAFIAPLVLIIALYVTGIVLVMLKCKTPVVKKRLWQPIICAILVGVSLLSNVIYYVCLPSYKKTYVENLSNEKFIYDTFNPRIQNFKMFGTYSYYFNNLLNLMTLKKTANKVLDIAVQTEFDPDDYGYESLVDQQLDTNNNLIMVLMETFERSAINEITMPNLYKFMQESCISVEGYYSIERTCYTDYISQVGTHALGTEMWSSYGNVKIPFSLANIFKNSNYVARAFHNYSGNFYDRRNVFTKSLGFDEFYDWDDYKGEYNSKHHKIYFNANKDETLFTANLEQIAPDDGKNFYSYLATISTHGLVPMIDLRVDYPEEFEYIEKEENLSRLKELYPWLDSTDKSKVRVIKNYLAGTISFDNGFGALLKYLRTTEDKRQPGKKLIETTAIVMFGDHYYYMNPSAVNPGENVNLIGNECPLIIYNPQAPAAEKTDDDPVVVKRFTATMDIYKTVCSMFGIVTDKQLTYGHSVLLDAEKYPDNRTLGVGYINGYTWGPDWRTSDFVHFTGRDLNQNPEELAECIELANRTYNAIVANMALYAKNGFKDLAKCQQYKIASYSSNSKMI